MANNLELRELREDMAGEIFAVVDRNRAHLREWLPWVDGSLEPADTRRFLRSTVESRQDGRTLGYAIYEEGVLRGIIGAHDINKTDANLKIGYWLSKDACGRGLMTRAVRAMLRIAFERLEMERVEIHCGAGNQPSCAIPERLGFRFEGVLRHAQRLNGRFIDHRLYAMLREEWAASAQNVEGGL